MARQADRLLAELPAGLEESRAAFVGAHLRALSCAGRKFAGEDVGFVDEVEAYIAPLVLGGGRPAVLAEKTVRMRGETVARLAVVDDDHAAAGARQLRGGRQAGETSADDGDIMVHGIRNGFGWVGSLHQRFDWTKGCIAVTDAEIRAAWEQAYGDETFVQLLPAGHFPRTADVQGANTALMGLAIDRAANRVVVVTAVDNLVKGTAGAAVQSMNIALGLDEATGLSVNGVAP